MDIGHVVLGGLFVAAIIWAIKTSTSNHGTQQINLDLQNKLSKGDEENLALQKKVIKLEKQVSEQSHKPNLHISEKYKCPIDEKDIKYCPVCGIPLQPHGNKDANNRDYGWECPKKGCEAFVPNPDYRSPPSEPYSADPWMAA